MENVIQQVKSVLEEALNKVNLILSQVCEVVIVQPITTNPEYILKSICDFFNIERADLIGTGRLKGKILKRKIAIYLLRKHTDLTLQQIAYLLNYKNHATVSYHLRDTENILSGNYYGYDDFMRIYKQLINYLKLQDNDTISKGIKNDGN
jgi:chromosomal replication initiator protein